MSKIQDLTPRLTQDFSQARNEVIPVGVIQKDLPALNTATDDVMTSARSVYASLTRHGGNIATRTLH